MAYFTFCNNVGAEVILVSGNKAWNSYSLFSVYVV